MASTPNRPKGRSIRSLRMVWGFALRYPGHIAVAALALLFAAAATSGVPYAFKLIIDKGFAAGAGTSRDIAPLVPISAAAGRRDGDRHRRPISISSPGSASARSPTSASPCTATCFGCRPASSRRTARPRSLRESRSTRRSSSRWSAPPSRSRLRNAVMGTRVHRHPVRAGAQARGLDAARGSAGRPPDHLPRPPGARKSRPAARTGSPTSATVTSEVLGAMKIVQAFNQQGRETSRFTDAVERVFATAKRRILLRALMTAIVIFLLFSAITLDHLAGRGRGRRRPDERRDHRRLRALWRTAGRRVRQSVGGLWRPACAPPEHRSVSRELLNAEPDIRAPAEPVKLPEPPRGELAFENVTFHYPTRRETSALDRFQPDREAARAARGRRAVGGWQDDACSSSPSAFTIRRAAGCCSTASICATPTPPTSA